MTMMIGTTKKIQVPGNKEDPEEDDTNERPPERSGKGTARQRSRSVTTRTIVWENKSSRVLKPISMPAWPNHTGIGKFFVQLGVQLASCSIYDDNKEMEFAQENRTMTFDDLCLEKCPPKLRKLDQVLAGSASKVLQKELKREYDFKLEDLGKENKIMGGRQVIRMFIEGSKLQRHEASTST